MRITVGSEFIIEAGGSKVRQFPNLSAFGSDVFAGFYQTPDEVTDGHPANLMRISRDGGLTWPERLEMPDFPPVNLVKLANGDLIGIPFMQYRIAASAASFYLWKSTDNGVSWGKSKAVVTFPSEQQFINSKPGRGGFSNINLLLLADGSLAALAYGHYSADTSARVLWMRSADGGINWKAAATVAYCPGIGTEGCDEAWAVECPDGSMLCVMRVGAYEPLYQCRSTDGGLTWSTPDHLPGVDAGLTKSVLPVLHRMTNGILALSYGRPYVNLLFSGDGCGYGWSNYTRVYSDTASGYTGMAEIAANRLIIAGDRGANWQNPAEYEIWGRYIDVVP